MGTIQNQDINDFQARVARIQGGHAPIAVKTRGFGKRRRVRAAPARRAPPVNDWRENIKYPGKIIAVFFLGMVAVFLSRYIRFHLGSGSLTGDSADMMMMIDGGVGVAAGFVLMRIFKIKGKEFKAAQGVGVFAMICIMHNFVHWAPQPFAQAFSLAWVEEVTFYTEPNSILFRGQTFVLDNDKADVDLADLSSVDINGERVMPQLLLLDSQKPAEPEQPEN